MLNNFNHTSHFLRLWLHAPTGFAVLSTSMKNVRTDPRISYKVSDIPGKADAEKHVFRLLKIRIWASRKDHQPLLWRARQFFRLRLYHLDLVCNTFIIFKKFKKIEKLNKQNIFLIVFCFALNENF